MPITGIYRVQAFLGLLYVCAGSAKLLGADVMVEAFDVTGLGQSLRVAVGLLEIGGGLCLFIPRASIYAAVVLGCTIIGILGAAVGHMGRLGIDQQPLAAPQLTNGWRANFRGDDVAAKLWHVPTALAGAGIEG
jgi:putative oxidoreductase